MSHTEPVRPFRFLAAANGIVDGAALAERARRAEGIGVDVLVIPDHLIQQLAPVPMLATVAAATRRLRIGTFVFNNDLRHPAVLAQELASLDVLSGGRLQVGMGAGWNAPEYRAIGLRFDTVPVRSARLEEAVAVLKGCFADGPFSFRGAHYTITEYDAHPKPVQKPHPPIFIGGGGRRTLELAAREANIVGLAPRLLAGQRRDPRSVTVAATAEKVEWVRKAAGDRFDQLELNIYPALSPIIVTDHAVREAEALSSRLADQTGHAVPARELLDSPHIFIGSVDGLVDKLRGLRERLGVSSVMVGELGELDAVVERLAGS